MLQKSQIFIKDNAAQLAREAANIFSAIAGESVTQRGHFSVAISGGSTPRDTHRMLAKEPHRSRVPWDKTHIFWVDERCVPADHPASNYGAAKEDFLDHVPIPGENIRPVRGNVPPEDGATKYQQELIDFFQQEDGEFPVFDLILLGIGMDGHTASLFPGQKALEEKTKLIMAVKGGDPDISRLTMTFPLINRARQILFLVSGKRKAAVVKAILDGGKALLPARYVQPLDGKLMWLLDRDSASELPKDTTS